MDANLVNSIPSIIPSKRLFFPIQKKSEVYLLLKLASVNDFNFIAIQKYCMIPPCITQTKKRKIDMNLIG